jgi:hypothetical protein
MDVALQGQAHAGASESQTLILQLASGFTMIGMFLYKSYEVIWRSILLLQNDKARIADDI